MKANQDNKMQDKAKVSKPAGYTPLVSGKYLELLVRQFSHKKKKKNIQGRTANVLYIFWLYISSILHGL